MRAYKVGGPATKIGDEVFFVGEQQVWKRAFEITETEFSKWIGYRYKGNETVLQFLEIGRKTGPIGAGKDRITSEAVKMP
jgi:hypothetical protein